jgi:hypothetical protein
VDQCKEKGLLHFEQNKNIIVLACEKANLKESLDLFLQVHHGT